MEFRAKTVEEAVTLGLSELGLEKDQAQIEILEQPTKGLFGRLKGQAVVEISKIEVQEEKKELIVKSETETEGDVDQAQENAKELVCNVLKYLGIDATADITNAKERTVITLNTDKSSTLIGYRGEVLDALQVLAGAMANVGKNEYKKVVVDCENYREKREDTLIKLAHKLEQKATEIRREVILEPMSPFERRIIHTALADSQTVKTTSNGKEPNRYVVIVPNDKDEYSRPYNAGRNNERSKRQGYGRKSYDRHDRDFSTRERAPRRAPTAKKPTKISFGTYLGNSLKDND